MAIGIAKRVGRQCRENRAVSTQARKRDLYLARAMSAADGKLSYSDEMQCINRENLICQRSETSGIKAGGAGWNSLASSCWDERQPAAPSSLVELRLRTTKYEVRNNTLLLCCPLLLCAVCLPKKSWPHNSTPAQLLLIPTPVEFFSRSSEYFPYLDYHNTHPVGIST